MYFEIVKEIKNTTYVDKKTKKEKTFKETKYFLVNVNEGLKIQFQPHSWSYKNSRGEEMNNSNKQTIDVFAKESKVD